ncbi:hypothetical protein ACHAXM_007129 [Skeletonema potamos]
MTNVGSASKVIGLTSRRLHVVSSATGNSSVTKGISNRQSQNSSSTAALDLATSTVAKIP